MTSDAADQTQPADVVERDIHVPVDAEEVWALVSRPGWWVNDGTIDDHPVLSTTDDLTTLTHPEWGVFAFRTLSSERPGAITFRWVPVPLAEDDLADVGAVVDELSTLVELTVEREHGGVRLRVRESGFAALSDDPEVWKAQLVDNGEGWQNELRAARDFVTANRG